MMTQPENVRGLKLLYNSLSCHHSTLTSPCHTVPQLCARTATSPSPGGAGAGKEVPEEPLFR